MCAWSDLLDTQMNLNNQQIELLTDLRQRLHSVPELSGSEINTARMVKEFLAKHTSARII